jgi:hypothetical protein
MTAGLARDLDQVVVQPPWGWVYLALLGSQAQMSADADAWFVVTAVTAVNQAGTTC